MLLPSRWWTTCSASRRRRTCRPTSRSLPALEGFDPHELSEALESRRAVRLLTMRGTIHVLTPADALTLRRWVQPALDQQSASNQMSRPARGVAVEELVATVRRLLEPGPLPVKQLGEQLAAGLPRRPGRGPGARRPRTGADGAGRLPEVCGSSPGACVYQTVENYLDRPTTDLDVHELVRRYLRAFGPATAADMTIWSRVTRLGPVFASMKEELIVVECEDGKVRYDVPGAPYAGGDVPAPVRLLGTYDNVWLSHANRDHIVPVEMRSRWAGVNGGVGNTVFVDGFMAGLWWWREGRVDLEVFRTLSKAERAELDSEVAAVETMLAD